MTAQTKTRTNNGSKPGIFGSIIDMGAATTNLAIDQFGNAMTAMIHPGAAIDHVRDTLENISSAMNTSASMNAVPHHEETHTTHTRVSHKKAHRTGSHVTAKAHRTTAKVQHSKARAKATRAR